MSRRPLGPGSQPSPQSRMAPGGRLWSESPLPRFAIRKVRSVGVEAERYYVSDPGSGYSSPTNASGWVLKWYSSPLGQQPPEAGWYDITFSFPLAAVHPSATTIRVALGIYETGDGVYTHDVPGGPFTVGQVVTFTLLGYIDSGYNMDITLKRVAASGMVEWTTNLAESFMTVAPASEPAAVSTRGGP